jgi:hypothetical protein
MNEGQTCAANINEAGRRRRLILGAVAEMVGTGGMLLARGDALWSVAALVPLGFGILCILQAVSRVCVVLAAQGLQETADGPTGVTDTTIVEAQRARARQIYVGTVVLTLMEGAMLFFAARFVFVPVG